MSLVAFFFFFQGDILSLFLFSVYSKNKIKYLTVLQTTKLKDLSEKLSYDYLPGTDLQECHSVLSDTCAKKKKKC